MTSRAWVALGLALVAAVSQAWAMFPDEVDPNVIYGQMSTVRAQARAAREMAEMEAAEHAAPVEVAGPVEAAAAALATPVGRQMAVLWIWIVVLFVMAISAVGLLCMLYMRGRPDAGAVCVSGRGGYRGGDGV